MAGISGAYDKPSTWLRVARQHEEEGDLQRALFEYRLAKTASRDDQLMRKHLRRVEKKIAVRTAELLGKAKRAQSRGQLRKARNLYLEILGLEPDHRQALDGLRELDKAYALSGMKRKRELDRQKRSGGTRRQSEEAYTDEGFSYSRQAILDAANQPDGTGRLLQELERHLAKYPKDNEIRREIIKSTLSQAERAYRSKRWDEALNRLNLADQLCSSDSKQCEIVRKARKHYARELYSQGVISYRTEPQKALSYWKYALKFDPEDDRSRLRIRSLSD